MTFDDAKLGSPQILGPGAASHLPVLVQILEDIGEHEYRFMANDSYQVLQRENWREAMRVYWLEILYRAHFAASTSLIRTARWVDAMITHAEEPNYTAFMAAYRGCLEASADSFHTFETVPSLLAELHVIIRLALAGQLKEPSVCKDLEDDLIHFTHARHVVKGEDVDDMHRAKQTKEYLESLSGSGFPEISECYRTLCDVTHPGIGSVACYAAPFSIPSGTGYHLRLDRDAAQISEFCQRNQKVSERMVYFGVVPPVMVVRLLNEFPIKELYTPGVMKVGAEKHPMWQRMWARLQDSRLPGESTGHDQQAIRQRGRRR